MKIFRLTHISLLLVQQLLFSQEAILPDSQQNERQQKIQNIFEVYEKKLKDNPDNLRLLYALGSAYYSIGEYKEALEYLNRAYKLDPNYKNTKKNIALTYLYLNRIDQALPLLQQEHERDKEDVTILAGLGRAYQFTYDYELAHKYFQQALSLQPDDLPTLTFYGDMLLQQKKYEQAEEVFKKILSLKPDDKEANRALFLAKLGPKLSEIQGLATAGTIEQAIDRYQTLLNTYPQEERFRLALGSLYVKLGRYSDAIDLYQRGLEQNPDSPSLTLALGQAYYESGNIPIAKETFEMVLKNNPDNVEALAGLAKIFEKLEDFSKANLLFEKGLTYGPYNETILYDAADFAMKQKKYSEALTYYERLSKINPSSTYLQEMVSQAKYGPLLDEIHTKTKLKQFSKVEGLYQNLLQKAPSNAEFYLLFGNFYRDQADEKKAQSLYEEGLKIAPSNASLQVALGFSYLKENKSSDGQAIFKKVLKNNPENIEALVGLGKVKEIENDPKEAEVLYLKAVESDPKNIFALSHLASFYTEQKKFQNAERTYKKIYDINPDLNWAKKSVDQIKFKRILEQIEKSQSEESTEQAEMLYLQMIQTSPTVTDYPLGLAELYIQSRRLEEAKELLGDSLAKNPDSAPLKTKLAQVLFLLGDTQESLSLYEQVIKHDPLDAQALGGLGKIAEFNGENEKARDYFQRALEISPNDVSTLQNLASFYVKQKEYPEALELYFKLKQILPGSDWIDFSIQDIYNAPTLNEIETLLKIEGLSEKERRERESSAEKLFAKILTKFKNNPNYYLRLGLLYQQMQRFDEAIATYKKGLAISKDNPALESAIGFAEIYKNNLDEAKQQFLEVVGHFPNYAEGWAGLGMVADLVGDDAEARSHFEQALALNPHSIQVLSVAAPYFAKQGELSKAQALYTHLISLQPDSEWAKKGLNTLQALPLISQAKLLEAEGKFEEAATIWEGLVSTYGDETEYSLALANLYMRQEKFDQAIKILNQSLSKNQGSIRIEGALGLALLFNKDLNPAQTHFENVLAQDPKNGEALAGLGQVYALQGERSVAQYLFQQALKFSPDNEATLSFYGDFLLKERRYDEAQIAYQRLVELNPEALWARRALKNAELGPQIDEARLFDQLDEDKRANHLYANLIGQGSGNFEYYLYLGDLYLKKERTGDAIRIYQMGMEAEPDSPHLRRAIAYAWLSIEEVCEAERIFIELLKEDPEDADSWAGLGRAQAIKGCYRLAMCYYVHALRLSPDNETAMTYFAQDQVEQQRYFSATRIYMDLQNQNPNTRWISDSLDDNWRKTRNRLTLDGRYYEEDEWDRNIDRWTARYQVYGGNVRLECPLNDCTWFYGRVRDDLYRLIDRINDDTQYFFNVTSVHADLKRNVNSCTTIEGSLGLSAWSPVKKAVFAQGHDVVFEPTLQATFHNRDIQSFTLGVSSDTDLVARDFDDYEAKMVTRYYVFGQWKRDFSRELLLTAEGGYYWLNDFDKNTFQRAFVSLYWRPECFFNNVRFLYFFQYQNFQKVIPDYWTYAPQLVNHIQVEYKFEYNDVTDILFGYAHGWQSSRTRFAQIVIFQPPVLQPFFWDRREYNSGFIRMNYDICPFKVSTDAWYYRDSKRYTIWYVDVNLTFEF
jgi:tetratricopeptide (TPR) repeat protein